MLGYCAMGKRVIEAAPTRIVRIAMTMAMTGRLMKNLPIAHLGGGAADGAAEGFGPPPIAGGGGGAVGGGGGGVGTGTGVVDIGNEEVSAGAGVTGCPALTFCMPSMTIRSAAFSPFSTTTNDPVVGPRSTDRISALLSAPMIATSCLPCSSWTARCGMTTALGG